MTDNAEPTAEESSRLRKELFDFYRGRNLPGFAALVEMIEVAARSGSELMCIGSSSIVDPENKCRQFKVALGIAPASILTPTSALEKSLAELEKELPEMGHGVLRFGGYLEYLNTSVTPTVFLDFVRERIDPIPADVLTFVDNLARGLSGMRDCGSPIIFFDDGPPHSRIVKTSNGGIDIVEYTPEERRVFELNNMQKYLDSYPAQCRAIDEAEKEELQQLKLHSELGWTAASKTTSSIKEKFDQERAKYQEKAEKYKRELGQ